MKKLIYELLAILLSFILVGCVTQPSTNEPQTLRYECSHGLANQTIYESGLHYTGSEIEFDYAFHNVNMDSNFGIMLFLNGQLQPFILNENSESHLQIVNLKKDTQYESVHISFNPINGEKGDTLQLTIVSIFDADTDYTTPTLAPAFFHSLSQSAPIKIIMDVDTTDTIQLENNTEYSCNFHTKSVVTQDQDAFNGLSLSEETLKPGIAFELGLLSAYEKSVEYSLYVFVNNQSILINDTPTFTVSCPPSSQVVIEGTLTSDYNKDTDLIYIIAVPNDVYDIESFPPVLKAETLQITS